MPNNAIMSSRDKVNAARIRGSAGCPADISSAQTEAERRTVKAELSVRFTDEGDWTADASAAETPLQIEIRKKQHAAARRNENECRNSKKYN